MRWQRCEECLLSMPFHHWEERRCGDLEKKIITWHYLERDKRSFSTFAPTVLFIWADKASATSSNGRNIPHHLRCKLSPAADALHLIINLDALRGWPSPVSSLTPWIHSGPRNEIQCQKSPNLESWDMYIGAISKLSEIVEPGCLLWRAFPKLISGPLSESSRGLSKTVGAQQKAVEAPATYGHHRFCDLPGLNVSLRWNDII